MQRRLLSLLALALGAVFGCTGGGQPPVEAPGQVLRRDLDTLPPVGEYLPAVDDGRLSVAPPADWNVLPRGRTFLIAFAKGKPTELPRILIQAEAPPDGCPETLTEESAGQFADQMAAEVEAEVKAGRKRVPEYHLPIVLGPTIFVRHVRHASLGGTLCAVQSLQTLRGGRLYTVELLVAIDAARADDYGAALKLHRDVAYTVAAHLKFAHSDQSNP